MPTSITTWQWYPKVYADEYTNTQLDIATDAIIPGQISTIAIDWMIQAEENGDFDIMLIQDFQETFAGWSLNHFNAMDMRVRTAVKNILRDRGVYIEKNSRNTIAQQLVNLLSLTRSPDWPIDELNVMRLNPDFKCRQIAEEAQHARTTRQSSHQPLPPTQRHTRYTQPSVPANSSVITTQQKEQDKEVENTVDVRPSVQQQQQQASIVNTHQQEQQACIATTCQQETSWNPTATQTTKPTEEKVSRLDKHVYGQKDNVACGPNYVPTIGTTDNTIVDQPSLPKVSIAAHTDLRSLYNFLVKLGTTKEKHRMIDIMTLREAYGHNDLMDIRWIDSRDNLVDAITKARWVDRDKTGTEPTSDGIEPTNKTGTKPTNKTGTEPTDKTGTEPTSDGIEPTNKTGTKPTNKTGTEPTDKTGTEPTSDGIEPTNKTGTKPTNKTGTEPTDKTGTEPTSDGTEPTSDCGEN
ncbi:hypothetical protein PTTW11_01480 [Pyrenophora teres f. teres]|uniref:Uncharacterized protein n=1 Tax=Pyrenophora teres f. teres TaxID=97479 RepID=A0A6S6VBR3_9PLEO|nr:hypothetical protein PTTW11_01480 [Pyrenophora teres f. teres]